MGIIDLGQDILSEISLNLLVNACGKENFYGSLVGYIGTSLSINILRSLNASDPQKNETNNLGPFLIDIASKTSSLVLSSFFYPGAIAGSSLSLYVDSFIDNSINDKELPEIDRKEIDKNQTIHNHFSKFMSSNIAVILSSMFVNNPKELLTYTLLGASPILIPELLVGTKKAILFIKSYFNTIGQNNTLEDAPITAS